MEKILKYSIELRGGTKHSYMFNLVRHKEEIGGATHILCIDLLRHKMVGCVEIAMTLEEFNSFNFSRYCAKALDKTFAKEIKRVIWR